MRIWLEKFSDNTWDRFGIFFGAVGCSTIGYQILHELRLPGPSSVSIWFVIGFFCVYLFWCLYGIRFRRRGIWLSNAVAAVLQLLFAAIVLAKS